MVQLEILHAAKESGNYDSIIDQIPYAKLLGVVMREENGQPLFELPFSDHNIGNVHLPALHGGAIGGFMENAALLHLVWARESAEVPRTIDFSLDFLRSGKAQSLYARCDITKQGKRVANVRMTAWQEDESKPVAVARAHFLLS
ncbi:PaaI family thioesterase [Chitinimonas viridis]|uniref:PaaI family thioesterase n=2 Tax=Chitinimonas TaxID=240411 RepID=A0ABT8B3P5_9NEIS|nr:MULTISPECIES: PaaI family thioesterase [Chitinimonas]MDN3576864.1 PaaI family thioesterase [Chitinimonas viridis]GLR13814.1 thioesterase [Chitinimonas prasina]